ncbi:MAG: PAP2 family protein, partial [Sphingobacteriaceae bacterium]|nr:PAP2 family protein [Sphingobacteriaceae bacterium]
MQKFNLVLFLFVFLTKSGYSENLDNMLVMRIDTNKNWYAGKIIPTKKLKPVSFIAPALLVGYGFAAINDSGILKELDLSTKDE